ncbi:mannitol-1-phosphate 5-dehydrogenase [Alkalihalobacillus sp. LMS39]|uniref:mannitol-1-phosphate 5-dehydrogenase n=1 Tax=Alkalihalobacillus sp. LMS39 TaxID=2924032 RepID=UPI001FB32003|nr:mannitol-1-phosphate 5-dehydrogenase [Alkalihalobacillus sp. LMS39]UOE93712.1 mannitol-1-phosphate 5-dehydrogenase [Alkalihalobacillus sp. LMS39]
MLAVHFGAGNIGRGFIGKLLSDAGYDVCFVDVNEEVVRLLNEKKQYRVVLADEKSEETMVANVSAINSMEHPEQVIAAIQKADLVTTAVGPTILKIISGLLGKGLKERAKQTEAPLNIIACENMVGGSVFLKEAIYENVTPEEKEQFDRIYGFPNAAVDRIVPNQTNDDKLMVKVEPFFEWVVDRAAMVGNVPVIEGVTYVDDLTPYIERKLFTVNTGHAVCAYIGYQAGLQTIKEAMEHPDVLHAVKETLRETGELLVGKYQFDVTEHEKYRNKIIGRFTNPHINDEIPRVARGPLRKLSHGDRLVSPAVQYFQVVEGEPVSLAKAIAAALQYDFSQDEEAVALQQNIMENGYEKTIQQVCGLESDHPLIALILKYIN